MKIQTKKSSNIKLQTYAIQSDSLHKYYDFETNQKGKVIIDKLLIEKLKNKKIKDKNDLRLAWHIIKIIKESSIDFDNSYNFTFYIENEKIKLNVGLNCAIIKNCLAEYENYLKNIENEIETYIQFELEKSDNNI